MESTPSPTGSQQTETDIPSTLLSLPTEVLARIVEFGVRQDTAYGERLLAAKNKELELVKLLEGAGQSLRSLSLVNKQLHALCCSHLFKTLRASKATHLMFRYYCCSAYSQSFTHALFDEDATEEALAYTLSSATTFPNLRSLSVHRSAALLLLGKALLATDAPAEDEEKDARASTFRRLAAKVSRAALLGWYRGGEAATMLRSFTNLTSLELVLHSADQAKDGGLTSALASLTKLRRLALDLTRHGQSNPTWCETTWGFEDTLRSLTLQVKVLDAETWRFVTRFSTLQDFRLEFGDTSIPLPSWTEWSSVFDAYAELNEPWSTASACKTLHSLQLRCPAPAALSILGALLSHGDSKLQHLSLVLRDLPELQTDDNTASPLFRLLALAPLLAHFSLAPLSSHGRMSSVSTLALRGVCETRGIILDCRAGLWDPFMRVAKGSEGVLRSAFTERRCDAAMEVLEWAVRYTERLKSTVDAEGVEELLALLEKLKARKMIEED